LKKLKAKLWPPQIHGEYGVEKEGRWPEWGESFPIVSIGSYAISDKKSLFFNLSF